MLLNPLRCTAEPLTTNEHTHLTSVMLRAEKPYTGPLAAVCSLIGVPVLSGLGGK